MSHITAREGTFTLDDLFESITFETTGTHHLTLLTRSIAAKRKYSQRVFFFFHLSTGNIFQECEIRAELASASLHWRNFITALGIQQR